MSDHPKDTLILSLVHVGRGGYALWWGPDRSGYYAELEGAGRYTRAEAESICGGSDRSAPMPLAEAQAKAVSVVDFNKLRRVS